MITTGIVRRIDELGRVVIPKEIRKTMRIKEGEELEVCVEGEDRLVLKKYSPVKTIEKIASEYAEVLSKCTECACYVCDNDEIAFAAGDRTVKIGDSITKALENAFKTRKSGFLRGHQAFPVTVGGDVWDICYAPVIIGGDVTGGIVLASIGRPMSGADKSVKLLEVAANFFAKQFD